MIAFDSIRGGPIVTIGGALAFLWYAFLGVTPKHRFPGEIQRYDPMPPLQRILWVVLALAMLSYEAVKLYVWTHPRN